MFQNQVVDKLCVLNQPTSSSATTDTILVSQDTAGSFATTNITRALRSVDISADTLFHIEFSAITATPYPFSYATVICGLGGSHTSTLGAPFGTRVPVTVTPNGSGSIVSISELVNVPFLPVPSDSNFWVGLTLSANVQFTSYMIGIRPYLSDVQSFNPLK